MVLGIPELDLPDHGVKTKHGPDGMQVFDGVRRRWVALTPEEWVRQHFVNYLVHDLGTPSGSLAVERTLSLNGLTKRADIVVHDAYGKPIALVECKAPHVTMDQRTFEQAARYNTVFKVRYLFITNGYRHFCCAVEHSTGHVDFLVEMPSYKAMVAG